MTLFNYHASWIKIKLKNFVSIALASSGIAYFALSNLVLPRDKLHYLITKLAKFPKKNFNKDSKDSYIVIYDPIIGGHHTLYTLYYSKLFLTLGLDVLIATESPDLIKEASKQYNIDISDSVVLCVKPKIPNNYWMTKEGEEAAAIEYWVATFLAVLHARNHCNAHGKLVVFFPWLDSFFPNSDEIFNVDCVPAVSYAGILFHPTWLRNKNSPKKTTLSLKNLKYIGVLDANISRLLSDDLRKSVFVLPDFSYSNPLNGEMSFNSVNAIKKKAKGRKIIGLLGSIERRKGILKFLEMAKSDIDEEYFYVCIGKLYIAEFNNDEINFIQSCKSSNNFYLETDKFIPSEEEINEIVCQLSCLWLRYENFYHGSNFLTKSATYRVPVLASNFGFIGEQVRTFNLGITEDDEDNKKLLLAISKVLVHKYDKSLLESFLLRNSADLCKPFVYKITQCEFESPNNNSL
jgi:hypothetical protein